MTSAHFAANFFNHEGHEGHEVHKGLKKPKLGFFSSCSSWFIRGYLQHIGEVDLSKQIFYGLEFRMKFLQHLVGRGLFFTGSGRQMLTGTLDGKLFFIEQMLDF